VTVYTISRTVRRVDVVRFSAVPSRRGVIDEERSSTSVQLRVEFDPPIPVDLQYQAGPIAVENADFHIDDAPGQIRASFDGWAYRQDGTVGLAARSGGRYEKLDVFPADVAEYVRAHLSDWLARDDEKIGAAS
jgi:hypothetical protein